MQLGDWISLGAALIAAIGVGAAAYYRGDNLRMITAAERAVSESRGARAAAERSALAAERSADAAESTALASKEYTDIEKARRADEERAVEAAKTARLRADMKVFVRAHTEELVVENRGPHDAQEIQINFDGLEDRLQFRRDLEGLELLRSGESDYSPILPGSMADGSKYNVRISWLDGAGERQEASFAIYAP